MDILAFLANLPAILGQHLATILGLIFMDVVIGVALAAKEKRFQWNAVASFYSTNVLPYGIGYLAVAGGLLFIAPELLPAGVADALALVGSWLGFGAIASQIVFGSLVPNAKALVLGGFSSDSPIVG